MSFLTFKPTAKNSSDSRESRQWTLPVILSFLMRFLPVRNNNINMKAIEMELIVEVDMRAPRGGYCQSPLFLSACQHLPDKVDPPRCTASSYMYQSFTLQDGYRPNKKTFVSCTVIERTKLKHNCTNGTVLAWCIVKERNHQTYI